ncbi:MAG: ubiE/COQ5 methyltransferase family protein [Gemmatimonadetes bacterium]|nr:ubiE/COQ5 methyltransferase family protein [Gemmatimonadota bacterium]
MRSFMDHFSESAALYASYRPSYPAELFAWLAETTGSRERAWDCGTGNGQAAEALAAHFAEVVATDPSHAQLALARRAERVHYAAMTAEASALASNSVQLITVAQALHWFDLSRFYTEARRILSPGGTLAVWTYGLLSVTPEIDVLIWSFYKDTLGVYWPAERALVDAAYAGLAFPFAERVAPGFVMTTNWTLDQLSGYLDTWSAVSKYRNINGASPVGRFISSLQMIWGDNATARRVTWPMKFKIGTS